MAYTRRRSFRSRGPRRKMSWVRTNDFVNMAVGEAGVIDLLPSNTTDRMSIVGGTVVRIRGIVQVNYSAGVSANETVIVGITKGSQTGQVLGENQVTPFIDPELYANTVSWMWYDAFSPAENSLQFSSATTDATHYVYRFDVKSQRVLRNPYDSISIHVKSPMVANFAVYASTLIKLP